MAHLLKASLILITGTLIIIWLFSTKDVRVNATEVQKNAALLHLTSEKLNAIEYTLDHIIDN